MRIPSVRHTQDFPISTIVGVDPLVLKTFEEDLVDVDDHDGQLYCPAGSISTFSLGTLHYRIQIMPERLISEAVKPLTETADTSRMAIGEPGLPWKFVWRGRTICVTAVLRSWRETGKCRHGSPEMYVRKHWYEVATESDGIMKLYFERQPRRGQKGARWWLFSIRELE
jgi:phosphoribosylglycinamide formyltransferase-1